MSDEREEQMLELMSDCRQTLRRVENQINAIWAEWTRTHRLNIEGHPDGIPLRGTVKRKVRR